jgi:hypothetical protein
MKNKMLSVFLPLLIITSSFNEKKIEPGYIKFQYNGDQSKPYPRILFYLPGSTEPLVDSISTDKLEISKAGFEAIRQAIEVRKGIPRDSALKDDYSYQFLVSNSGETTIFLTPYLPRIRDIFYVVSNQLKTSENEMRMKKELQSLLNRIMYDNRLK